MSETITADAITEIERLVRESGTTAEFVKLPEEIVPQGARVTTPYALRVRKSNGDIEFQPVGKLLDDVAGKPRTRTGKAVATTLQSFIDLVNRHKSADTAIFVDSNWRAPKLTAVVDYHQEAERAAPAPKEGEHVVFPSAPLGDDPYARQCRHRIEYAFPLSDSWKTWVGANGKEMGQGDFAAFLEDHVHEIASPTDAERTLYENQFKTKFATPNELIDLSRGLVVHVDSKIANKKMLQTGETQMVFETTHKDASGNELFVPGIFLICVPPFHRGDAVRIPARLRYRTAGGAIVWFYQMFRPDQFIDERVADDVTEVEAATKLPAYHGAPEVASVSA